MADPDRPFEKRLYSMARMILKTWRPGKFGVLTGGARGGGLLRDLPLLWCLDRSMLFGVLRPPSHPALPRLTGSLTASASSGSHEGQVIEGMVEMFGGPLVAFFDPERYRVTMKGYLGVSWGPPLEPAVGVEAQIYGESAGGLTAVLYRSFLPLEKSSQERRMGWNLRSISSVEVAAMAVDDPEKVCTAWSMSVEPDCSMAMRII